MLAWYMPRPGVCLSVTSQYSIEADERTELVFGTQITLGLSYTAL